MDTLPYLEQLSAFLGRWWIIGVLVVIVVIYSAMAIRMRRARKRKPW